MKPLVVFGKPANSCGACSKGGGARWRRGSALALSLAVAGVMLLLADLPAAAGEAGRWREASQLVWDAQARQLVRKAFVVWDPHPELALDFRWEAAPGTADEGIVNGEGRLIWLARGAPAYDRQAIYSEYKGELRDGRPEGDGRMRLRSGRIYDGTWHRGIMSGQGMLRLENGDRYHGTFAGGVPHGEGRLAAVDGTVFEGTFRDGSRDGAGTLVMPDGRRFRSVWRQGEEVERAPITDGTLVAQSGGVAVSVYIDTRMNSEFMEADPDYAAYAYTAYPDPGHVQIQLDAPQIIDLWKGGGVIQADENGWAPSYFEDSAQFAPVFLVVDLRNDGHFAAEVTSTYLDIGESSEDLQPYIVAWPDFGPFSPEFTLKNYGWGPIRDARLTYAFANDYGQQSPSFAIDLGTFADDIFVSVVDGLAALGANVGWLVDNEYAMTCPDYEYERCAQAIRESGVFGGMTDATFIRYGAVLTRLTGVLEYTWTDAYGRDNRRSSPVSIDLSLSNLSQAEMGAPPAVERGFPTVTLPLGQRDVRVPINYTALIEPGGSRRFALNLVAEKSSRHVFQFEFDLADGTTAASPMVDLLYFLPRFRQIN